jgi:hypothetical protein
VNDVFTIPHGTSGEGSLLYAMIFSTQDAGFAWNASLGIMQAYNATFHSSYALSVVEIGTTGIYRFVMPLPLQVSGRRYTIVVYKRPTAGDPPSPTDQLTQSGAIQMDAAAATQPNNVTIVSD